VAPWCNKQQQAMKRAQDGFVKASQLGCSMAMQVVSNQQLLQVYWGLAGLCQVLTINCRHQLQPW